MASQVTFKSLGRAAFGTRMCQTWRVSVDGQDKGLAWKDQGNYRLGEFCGSRSRLIEVLKREGN